MSLLDLRAVFAKDSDWKLSNLLFFQIEPIQIQDFPFNSFVLAHIFSMGDHYDYS